MTSKLNLIVGFVTSVFIAHAANAESWVLLEKTNYLDKDSITKHDGLVRVWIKNIDPRNNHGDKMWDSTIASYDIDCDRSTSAITSFHFIQFSGTKSAADLKDMGVQSPILPGGLLHKASQLACKKMFEFWK
jgi:hypothetical protein